MLLPLFQLFATIPLATVLLVIGLTWLLRRRPGRLRHGWLLGFGALLLAADDPTADPPDPTAATPASHTFEAGLGGGSFQTCSGARRYSDVGAMYRYSTPISDETNLTLSGGAYGAYAPGASAGALSGAVRGSVGLEHRWAGGSLGFVTGALARDTPLGPPILPAATLRLGPRDMAFLDASFLSADPAPLPGPGFEVGAGVAFPRLGNRWEPLRFRAGVSLAGVYFAPTLPLGEHANLEVMTAYGDPNTWGASARVRVHFDADPPL